jgi:hypothetical protein
MTSKEKKELLNKLKDSFREDVKIHLLAERTYVGTRRSALEFTWYDWSLS